MNVPNWRVVAGSMLAAAAISQSRASEEEKPKPFTLEQAVELVGKEFVDPKGAELVEFQMTARGVWGMEEKVNALGWKEDGVLEFADRSKVPEGWAHQVKPAAFPDAIAVSYREKSPDKGDGPFIAMRFHALGGGENHLVHAAWLEQAGRHDEALRALAAANAQMRMSQTALEVWRNERAWFYYAGMVHAFMVGRDVEAETYGELLLQRFPKVETKLYPQAGAILADIRRRKDHPLPSLKNVDGLPLEERIRRHIAEMEDIAEFQSGQPGGVDLAAAPSVKALIIIGDPAVPALLDTLEHDTRLTRSVHFWRDFAPYRTVLSVREAALTALMSILRTEFFDPCSTGDNFTGRGDQDQTVTARRIRNYWEKFGKQPFDERMMTVLTAEESSAEARREAAWNLATLNDEITLGTTVWTGAYRKKDGPNPVITKFSNPTVAEAILKSLNRESVEICAETLGLLGDRRIAAGLVQRSNAATDPLIRATWARTADELGDSSAVLSLKDALVADTLDAPPESDRRAFRVMFECLAESKQPDAILGLRAVLKKDHRWRRKAVEEVLSESHDAFGSNGSPLFHPWCLELLGELLDDKSNTNKRLSLEVDGDEWRLVTTKNGGESSSKADPRLLDEAVYDRSSTVRRCDQAAMVLLELLGDHTEDEAFPLAKNRDSRISGLKQFLKARHGTFHNFTEHLDGGTGCAISGGRFLPVPPPLDHAATPADVAAGRARFSLDDTGRHPDIRPPLATEWYGRKPSGHVFSDDPDAVFGRRVVVMQIERDSKGDLWFCIADGNGFFVVPSKEIGVLEALDPTEP